MWLSILIVVGLVGGLALAIGGAGILGFPLMVAGLAALAMVFVQRGAKTRDQSGSRAPSGADDPSSPQDTGHAGRFRKTGHAHRGQKDMVP